MRLPEIQDGMAGRLLFSRQVVGWSMQPRMHPTCTPHADQPGGRRTAHGLLQAHPGPGLIFHSDRGGQCCSREFQAALASYGMRSSMRRKGNCWDTQSTMGLSAASGLTRAGIGVMPLR